MSSLSNAFSILSLDEVNDKQQIVTDADTKLKEKSTENCENLEGREKIGSNRSDNGVSVESLGEFKKPLVSIDLEMTDKSTENCENLEGREKIGSNRSDNGVSVESLGEFKKPLVWIDLEMTGLDVEVDRILEIACIVTDGRLTKSVEGPDLVIKQPKESLDNMGDWCKEHHSASGLTKKVLHSTITAEDAEKQVIEFIKKHIGSDVPLLAGNSIYVDLLFLKKYMPNLAAIFPHVLVDVSSITALCARWFPRDKKRAPAKQKNHRAMDDIRESIRELKYYKECIFKNHTKSRR